MLRGIALMTLVFVITGAAARADVPPDAQALFDQGIADMAAGKLDVACKELAASLARYPDMGTRGALATCYTQVGRLASAWALWNELADTETDPARRASAVQYVAELAPRLPRYQLVVSNTPPPGLVVTVNGGAVVDPTLSTALPVDPGPLMVVASAPGRQAWTATLQASEGKTTQVDVPELLPTTSRVPPSSASLPSSPSSPGVREQVSPARAPTSHRRAFALAFGGVGLAGIGVGVAFGVVANGHWNDAQSACGGAIAACPPANVGASQHAVDSARTAAAVATVAFGLGAAAAVAGVVLWLTSPNDEHHAVIAPHVDSSSATLVLEGRF